MKLDYFTLLSDELIRLPYVGNLIPPKLIQIRKVGFSNYNMFLVLLRMTPEMYYTKIKKDDEYWNLLTKKEKNSLKIYDVIKKEMSLAINYVAMFSFFFEQDVFFNDEMFLMLNPEFEHKISENSINTEKGELVGIICEENFKTVLSMISQLCYMEDNSDNDEENIKFKNSKAKRLWDKMKKANIRKKTVEDSTRSIPNMISSVSAQLKIDINKVWNWTVFQLYDQFTRIGFCEAQDRNARSVSVWGDKEGKFKTSIWCTNYYEK